MCTTGMPDAHGGSNRALDPLKVGVTVGCEPLCGCWDPSRVFCKSECS